MSSPEIRTMRSGTCFVCGAAGECAYEGLHDRICEVRADFGFQRCPGCGLYWLDPRPVADDIPQCYRGYAPAAAKPRPGVSRSGPAWAVRSGVLCGRYGYRHLHNTHILCRMGRLFEMVPGAGGAITWHWGPLLPRYEKTDGIAVLDVGCGSGEYLSLLRELGLTVLGIEVDPVAVAALNERGIPAIAGTVETAGLEDGSVGMITMRHVIEHLPDPIRTIAECWRILRPGGRFVVRTPNFESLGHKRFGRNWLHLDPPRHLFGLTVSSARALYARTPFRTVSMRTLALSAGFTYDASACIERSGRFTFGAPCPHAPGRRWFAFAESLQVAAGKAAGEELEIVAEKER